MKLSTLRCKAKNPLWEYLVTACHSCPMCRHLASMDHPRSQTRAHQVRPPLLKVFGCPSWQHTEQLEILQTHSSHSSNQNRSCLTMQTLPRTAKWFHCGSISNISNLEPARIWGRQVVPFTRPSVAPPSPGSSTWSNGRPQRRWADWGHSLDSWDQLRSAGLGMNQLIFSAIHWSPCPSPWPKLWLKRSVYFTFQDVPQGFPRSQIHQPGIPQTSQGATATQPDVACWLQGSVSKITAPQSISDDVWLRRG